MLGWLDSSQVNIQNKTQVIFFFQTWCAVVAGQFQIAYLAHCLCLVLTQFKVLSRSWGLRHFYLLFQMNWIMTFTHGRFIFKHEWEVNSHLGVLKKNRFAGDARCKKKKKRLFEYQNLNWIPTRRTNIWISKYSGPALIALCHVNLISWVYLDLDQLSSTIIPCFNCLPIL